MVYKLQLAALIQVCMSESNNGASAQENRLLVGGRREFKVLSKVGAEKRAGIVKEVSTTKEKPPMLPWVIGENNIPRARAHPSQALSHERTNVIWKMRV